MTDGDAGADAVSGALGLAAGGVTGDTLGSGVHAAVAGVAEAIGAGGIREASATSSASTPA